MIFVTLFPCAYEFKIKGLIQISTAGQDLYMSCSIRFIDTYRWNRLETPGHFFSQPDTVSHANYVCIFCIAADKLIPHKSTNQIGLNAQLFSSMSYLFKNKQ